MSLKVLIADDSALFRRVLADALAGLSGVETIGSVANGAQALAQIRRLRPDLLTLDMEMPELDGLGVLEALRESRDPMPVIVVSALTRKGGELTLRALEKGAFDFITKPEGPSPEANREAIRKELAPRLRALAHRLEVRRMLSRPAPSGAGSRILPFLPARSQQGNREKAPLGSARPDVVLIGVSTGGPNALSRVLPGLPGNLGVPVLVVQHMPPVFTQALAESLAGKCALRVKEAAHGEAALPNTVYLAPGGRQMRLVSGPGGGKVLQITDDPPENNCRPSVDYLFRSAAYSFPGRSVAVILTGMGNDGMLGLKQLKAGGCFVIAQDAATCVVFGMPKAAVEAGVTDIVLPLEAIAARITAAIRGWPS